MSTKDELFIKEFNNLKNKVILNWFEIFMLSLVAFLISLKFLTVLAWESSKTPLLFSIGISLIITWIFIYLKKYQLSITKFDKDNLHKQISQE